MTLVVLVILAALWAVVLLPPLLRSRTERSNDSIGDFNYRLGVLGRTNGARESREFRATSAGPVARSAKRRREVMRVLLTAVGVTGLLALATNVALIWALHALADVALLGFFALWVWARSVEAERVVKVRPMRVRQPHRPQQGELPLRRAASS